MEACGLVVEYNPFHNGHQFHLEQAKKVTSASCTIAVMSGNFLQRGEPAIIDKFHRTKVAIDQGVDIVVELPFAYAVQNSDLFSRGAILTLGELGVSSLCFGSEHGEIDGFIKAYQTFSKNETIFNETLKAGLSTGISFPEASKLAYEAIGLTHNSMIDLSQPNNILGFSYVKNIEQTNQSMEAVTIKRTKNNYHDVTIKHSIASATSIRKEIIKENKLSNKARATLPNASQLELMAYFNKSGRWHQWEQYFPFLHHSVLTMSKQELGAIHGVEEGMEYRLKRTAIEATSFESWMNLLKTKRYTWTRLQRVFAHLLTNTKKEDLEYFISEQTIPYIRLLGMSEKGQAYLNKQKKKLNVPLVTSLKRKIHPFMEIEERASNAYYSVVKPQIQRDLRKQEILPPYILRNHK